MTGQITPFTKGARPSGPDRDAVLEEAAQVCDKLNTKLKHEAQQKWDRDDVQTGDELNQQAAGTRQSAEAIRALAASRSETPAAAPTDGPMPDEPTPTSDAIYNAVMEPRRATCSWRWQATL